MQSKGSKSSFEFICFLLGAITKEAIPEIPSTSQAVDEKDHPDLKAIDEKDATFHDVEPKAVCTDISTQIWSDMEG